MVSRIIRGKQQNQTGLCDSCFGKLCVQQDDCSCQCHSQRSNVEQLHSGVWIEKRFVEKIKVSHTSNAHVLHASGIGDSARLVYLKYLGMYKDESGLQSVRYMENGTNAHKRWESHLQQAGLLVASERPLIKRVGHIEIRGRLDFVIRNDAKKRNELVELKTTGRDNASKMERPEDAHIAQWAIYSDVADLPFGYVVVEDRDSLRPKYFPLERRAQSIIVYTQKGIVHERLENYLGHLYSKIRFAVWCADNAYFPKGSCRECIRYGCKQPQLCKELEKTKKLIDYETWLNEMH